MIDPDFGVLGAKQFDDFGHGRDRCLLVRIEGRHAHVPEVLPVVRDVAAQQHGAAPRQPYNQRAMPWSMARREDHAHGAVSEDVVVTIDDLVRPLLQHLVVRQRVAELVRLRSEHRLKLGSLSDPFCVFEQIDISDVIEMGMGQDDRADIAGPHADFIQLVGDGTTHDAAYAMRDDPSSGYFTSASSIPVSQISHSP
ncbi:hypothetical protein AOQ71_24975 [Bradyrhizobium manausense]|uniref:Uncharacterized protein n=1 Tax=Bradyrhizobium manausense TaxID=989370 RepID=A0A0R3DIG4_9BRAD|nr:hypothetical protein AOQ71_24975 [Bradyrhizobium manausense]